MSKDKLVRIVRMTFKKDLLDQFLEHYRNSHDKIKNFKGCLHLELWQEYEGEPVYISFSEWESLEALEAYRHSDLFRQIWRGTRRFFATPPDAYSLKRMPEFKN